ncbi:hypothetical protein [Mucilaginibacter sabulilitoris]
MQNADMPVCPAGTWHYTKEYRVKRHIGTTRQWFIILMLKNPKYAR